MFGESVWCITKALAIRFGGHKLSSPVFKLSSVKHKHEVNWEPIKVTPNGLLENLSSNTIECSQVAIKHYLLAANQINSFSILSMGMRLEWLNGSPPRDFRRALYREDSRV